MLTVAELVHRVFPEGTVDGTSDLSRPPDYPPDLFAIVAHLLHLGGAYHNVVPPGDMPWPPSTVRTHSAELSAWCDAGERWRTEFPELPSEVSELWERVWEARDEPVFREPDYGANPPSWWKAAYGLLVIADEASVGAGYFHAGGSGSAGESLVALTVNVSLQRPDEDVNPSDRHRRTRGHVASICLWADRDVVCVHPKAHTPEVGCTTRSLTRHLAYLPPRGVMRAHWQRSPTRLKPETENPLRLLLIPFPFTSEAEWFQAVNVPADHAGGGTYPWGWFRVDQRWLGPDASDVVRMVSALLRKATESVGPVNGVVFPECALNWKTYKAVADTLRDEHPDVEFLVAGSSTNCVGEEGNFALSSHFFEEEHGEAKTRMASTTSRAKHHRWRLDRSQIEAYGLQSALDPSLLWWEGIPLPQREINVNVVRRASTFTTMICEDLARSEPCHDVLRALGPNLVFVLLMDGPQLPFRWPARYATGLAEDPGSSVLTLTSRCLVARGNDVLRATDPSLLNGRKEDWTVALWRDSGSAPYQVTCPPGNHAALLTLEGKIAEKATLDGRHNQDAVTWRRVGDAVQVTLDPVERARHARVLGLGAAP